MLMYFVAGFFLNLTVCMTKLRVLVLSFPDFTDISIRSDDCVNSTPVMGSVLFHLDPS
jgi:hypothetical protein